MSHLRTSRATLVIACVAAGTVLFASVDAAEAKRRKKKRKPATVSRIEAPLGLAGTRGSGPEVAVPFTLQDPSRRKTDIEVQYGIDRDGSGQVEEGEWQPATENLIDERNTRSNRKKKYSTAANIGAAQAWVWSSLLDLGTGNYPTLAIEYTPQGRVVEDPANPGQPKFKDTQPGVRIRVRANNTKTGPGEWAVTEPFAVNNNNVPSMTIDGVLPNTTSSPTASDEVIEIRWTAFDPDSEDANGNGVLDILDGEDLDLDGNPDFEKIAVAFDYHEVLPGEDPASMTPEELAALSWRPCTRAPGVGDADDGVDSSPVGRPYTFAWDSVTDVGTVNKQYILRARPFDVGPEEHGDYAYFNSPFTVDNWKIFNTIGDGNLLGGRVGVTATNMTSELERSDSARPAPFQTFVVAGGMDGNAPTTDLTIMLVSTESADTSTASPLRLSLDTARAYHSATMLSDGRILFAGGMGADGQPTNSTEIYDPDTRSIAPGPTLLTARMKHTAVRLSTGDVAFFGGEGTSGALNSVEIFNFTPVGAPEVANTAGPAMSVAQVAPHAVLLPNQRVLVTGGMDAAGNAVTAAELFNPLHDDDLGTPTTKNPRFEPTVNSMTTGRRYGSATALLDGNVLFAGGVDDGAVTKTAAASMEVFNAVTGEFHPVSVAMPGGPRAQHVASLLGDGSVLIAGGTTDPDLVTPDITGDADVFMLGAFNGSSWDGTFLPVNGDMRIPRRNAAATAVNNGRVMIVGGQDASGASVGTSEIFVPENGVNLRPSARVSLASDKQSWAFGAPIVYRLWDQEMDPARVVVQFSEDSGVTWHAASAQATTIGGDVAELTAGLATTMDDDGSPIDFVNNASDHIYIWGMSQDIDRPIQAGLPLPGGGTSDGTKEPFNLRVIPFGAVQGNLGVSTPVTVLFNTKVLATIWPLEDADGTVNPNQGGDITITAHLRDIDGNVPGSNGDTASILFEYAVDTNGDGLILSQDLEFWFPMTPAGAPVGNPQDANPQSGLFTYFDAPEDSDSAFGQRPADKGWTTFRWDSVYDLGAPAADFDGRVQMRATPSDLDEGFATVLRNAGGETHFNLIKHPDALFLESFTPKGGNVSSVKVNEPLDFLFNGLLDHASINSTSLRIYRNNSLVQGTFVTQQNVPTAGKTLVTFYPLPQSTDSSNDIVYGEDDANTVLFPFNEYRFEIPGYTAQTDPTAGTTLRQDNAGAPTVFSTYLLVQNVPMDGDVNPMYRFNTASGYYDDGIAVGPDASVPVSPVAGTVLGNTQSFTINLSKAIDFNTVKAPNLQVHVTDSTQTDSVVPGYWRSTNTQDPVTGATMSSLTFFPHFKLPADASVRVYSSAGLLGENGRPVMDASTGSGYLDVNYGVTDYGRQSKSITETYSNTDQEDTSIGGATVRAAWGTDPCSPNTITGLQGGGSTPTGGPDVTVTPGTPERWTATSAQYGNVTVQKGATLIIDAASPPTYYIAGDFIVEGTVTFRGANGYSGWNGNASGSTYYYYAHTRRGTRQGGTGRNGGGDGGDSICGTANSGRTVGEDGDGTQGGEGGNVATFSTAYYYGGGGGAGGGHGTDGFNGGRATGRYNTSSYGNQSTRGFETGDPNFGSGATSGSGGGGGASHRYSSYYNEGGAGGAGAGAVTFNIAGLFDLRPTGLIDGRGGEGGSKSHLGGAGGGGSGGGLYILAGQAAILDGVIDLRGGRGGPPSFGYYSDYSMRINAYAYGTARFGGDGGLGRCRIEAGNFANVDEVRVFGQLMTEKINTLPTTSIASSSVPSFWSSRSTSARNLGSATDIRYSSSLNVPSSAIVHLTGTNAKRIWVNGDITIDGYVRANGAEASYYPSTSYDYPYGQESSSSTYYTYLLHYLNHSNNTSAPSGSNYNGFTGQLGGGNGGAFLGSSGMRHRQAKDGQGPSPGKHKIRSSSPGYQSGSYEYFVGQSGGGGGGNATAGNEGFAPYAVPGRYDWEGRANASNGNGILPHNGGEGGAALDSSLLTHANINLFAGGGGAGGNSGGREYTPNSWRYFGLAGRGGAAAGALAFIATGDITVRGRIEARGGGGNHPGAAYPYYYSHAGGGGASGGTIMLIGQNVTIARATSESINSGATIDLLGGTGGGWRAHRTGTPNQYPTYCTHGNFGGDGGYGRLVIQYTNELNGGNTLLNRWGMEQSTNVFHDGKREYRALAGSLTYKCYGAPRGGSFRSKWYDLESINPTVNSLSMSSSRMNLTLTGEGAQSHPHNAGSGGIGEPDASNTSGFRTITSGALQGWRWFRFNGVFTRQSSTGLPPSADNTSFSYETDQ